MCLLYNTLLQVFEHFDILSIGLLGIKLFVLGVESVVYAANDVLCFSIGISLLLMRNFVQWLFFQFLQYVSKDIQVAL